jgi:MFS family permease
MRRAWLTRNLVVLTLVSLTQDAASELLYPLLPLFITGVLAAPPVVLGLVEGSAEAAAGISKYVAGRWSDGRRRLPFVTTGYGMAALGKVIVAASYAWPTVLLGRVVDRVGKGVRSAPRDALIAASVPREDFGKAFGFHRSGDTLGAVIGPLLALAGLAVLDGNVRAVLWWAVVPAVLSTLLTLFVVERRASPAGLAATPASGTGPPAAGRSSAPRSPLPRTFWRVTIVLVGISVVNFPDALLLLRVSDLGFTTSQVVLAYVAFNIVYTLGSYPAGAWSDRLARPLVYGVGLLAFAVAYAGLGLVGHSGWVFVLMGLYGVFPAFTDGVGKAWISSLVTDEHRGRAQGVFQSLTNGAVFVAGVWAGLTWTLGPGGGVVPLLVSGLLGAVGGLVLMVGRHSVTGIEPGLA